MTQQGTKDEARHGLGTAVLATPAGAQANGTVTAGSLGSPAFPGGKRVVSITFAVRMSGCPISRDHPVVRDRMSCLVPAARIPKRIAALANASSPAPSIATGRPTDVDITPISAG